MNKATAETAKNLGIKAFNAGKARVTGWDTEIMAMVEKAIDSKSKCAMMAAWLKGWDSCLIAEMMAA